MDKKERVHTGTPRKTTEIFIKEATELNGDTYDYSETVYINSKTKVKIICREHGPFMQSPKHHIHRKQGCPLCARKKMSTEEYIRRAIKKNGTTYDYSETTYVDNKKPVTIICKKHGKFTIRADQHLQGQGCNDCAHEYVAECNTKNTPYFTKKSSEIHDNFYNYSEAVYVDMYTKLKIICPVHGEFWQTPQGHYTGRGCTHCGTDRTKKIRRHTTEQFIENAVNKHGNVLDYSKVVYVNNSTKVEIICPTHGVFSQRPGSHLSGKSCPHCARDNNDIAKRMHQEGPAILYYVRLYSDGCVYYKIGVTSSSVDERFRHTRVTGIKVVELQTWYFETGGDAFKWENSILKIYKQFKTKDKPLRSGNTEVFDTDILNLDK